MKTVRERVREIRLYEGNGIPRVVYEVDGLQYTPEQWQLIEFLDEANEKLDKVIDLLTASQDQGRE